MDANEQKGLQRITQAQIDHKSDVPEIHKKFDLAAIEYIRATGADKLADALAYSMVVNKFEYGSK